MNILPENLYARNIQESFGWFYRLQNASRVQFPVNIWNQLYDKNITGKLIETIEEFDLSNQKRTAIILLGLSCCGKTSYALDFIQKYPNFNLLSIDQVELEIFLEFIKTKNVLLPTQIADELTNNEFGRLLEEYSKSGENLIIDGQFVYCNARGALIKTLRKFGYKNVIIFNFLNIPNVVVKEKLQFRALEEAMFEELHKKNPPSEMATLRKNCFGKNPTEMLVSMKPIEEWKDTQSYKQFYKDLYNNYFRVEPIDCGLEFQLVYNLLRSGVNYIYNVF